MSKQVKIPSPETRADHIAKLRELNSRMDKHIIDLDELNACLEANFCKQRWRIECLRVQKQKTLQDE